MIGLTRAGRVTRPFWLKDSNNKGRYWDVIMALHVPVVRKKLRRERKSRRPKDERRQTTQTTHRENPRAERNAMRTSPSSSSSLARLLLLGVLGLFVGCSMSGGGVMVAADAVRAVCCFAEPLFHFLILDDDA